MIGFFPIGKMSSDEKIRKAPYLPQGGEGRHVRWFEGQDLDVNGDYVSSER